MFTSTEYVEKVVNDPQKPTAANNLVRGEILCMNRSLFKLFGLESRTGVAMGMPARKPSIVPIECPHHCTYANCSGITNHDSFSSCLWV
ncbi:hypothetical protein HJC23_003201 [Cyclotella cryptica]|uniref:Uncharacterized protein n=1 Tax=Cyclotella cryptica TaxID=29204 RepID=A0ABD3NPD4_9STRA